MSKLIQLIALLWPIIDALKGKTTDLSKQIDDAQAENTALRTQIANLKQQVSGDQSGSAALAEADAAKKAADAKAASTQAELDELHNQADQAALDIQAHLDSLNPPATTPNPTSSDASPADAGNGQPAGSTDATGPAASVAETTPGTTAEAPPAGSQ